MRYFEILSEMPIGDFEFHGDLDTPGTFRTDDLKKFRTPEWKERVVRMFSRSPILINLHIINGLVNDRGAHVVRNGKGWLDRTYIDKAKEFVGLQSADWVKSILGSTPPNTDGSLNVLLMNNEGSARVGLTPWMVAHRIGHCFFESNSREVNSGFQEAAGKATSLLTGLINLVEKAMDAKGEKAEDRSSESRIAFVASKLSGFRSARTGNLRDNGEYIVELFAQYLIEGRVVFKTDFIDGLARAPLDLSPVEAAILDGAKAGHVNTSAMDLFLEKGGSWWSEQVDKTFTTMKGNPLRPKTRVSLDKIMRVMVENDKFNDSPRDGWSVAETLHHQIEEYTKRMTALFNSTVARAVGKWVVL